MWWRSRAYLKALKEIGVKGFRIDAAKHMTLSHLRKMVRRKGMPVIIAVDRAEDMVFLGPYLQTHSLDAYDFPLFNTIFKSLKSRAALKSLINPYCFGQALSNMRAIRLPSLMIFQTTRCFWSMWWMKSTNDWLTPSFWERDGGVPLVYSELSTSGIHGSERSASLA